jgi:hypothetical protein
VFLVTSNASMSTQAPISSGRLPRSVHSRKELHTARR